ncbi:MAG: AzlD domain-containing protein [Haloarculaceae archaeon]
MTAPDATVWAAVALAGVGTYALRASFLFLFEYLGTVPARVETALGMVPAAVLSALVVPAILAPDGTVVVAGNDRLLAGVAAALVAWYTENILATIVVGLAVLIGIGFL